MAQGFPLTPRDLSARLQQVTSRLQSREGRAATAVVAVSTFAFVFTRFYANYKAWRALGPAGVPGNPFGWWLQWLLQLLFGRERTSTAVYQEPWKDKYTKKLSEKEATLLRTRFLPAEGLPRREGPRPVIANFVIPHRQTDAVMDMELKQLQTNLLGLIHRENLNTTILGPSRLEKGSPAIQVLDGLPMHSIAKPLKREICHGHLSADPPDRSSHTTLSYTDAKEVIEKGWGERHPLSGSPIGPPSFLMIYAPRNKEELEVLGTILRASTKFMVALV